MKFKPFFLKIRHLFYRILRLGSNPLGVTSQERQRLYYFNAILLSLPIVYFLFIINEIKIYLRPLSTWYFDQYSFFIFVLVCLLCYFLNHLKLPTISKLLFIVSWPIVLHIAPIIIQQTPSDYYYAFPIAIIFHSILIQVIFSYKKDTRLFITCLTINFILVYNFLGILLYFDHNGRNEYIFLLENRYNVLVVVLYWLLINFITFFLMAIIDSELRQVLRSKEVIMGQKIELESQYQTIQMQAEELQTYNEALNRLNESLEEKVKLRTADIEKQKKILEDHAFYNSHQLRKPVSNILGLIQLLDMHPGALQEAELLEQLKKCALTLDEYVREIQENLKT